MRYCGILKCQWRFFILFVMIISFEIRLIYKLIWDKSELNTRFVLLLIIIIIYLFIYCISLLYTTEMEIVVYFTAWTFPFENHGIFQWFLYENLIRAYISFCRLCCDKLWFVSSFSINRTSRLVRNEAKILRIMCHELTETCHKCRLSSFSLLRTNT